MASTIYIIYNAKGSIIGKLNYAYRKLTTPSSPCAACDLTHGGLRLSETAQWMATKKQINAEVKQLHVDELNPELTDYTTVNSLKYPVVLGKRSSGSLELLMTADQLATCSGDHEQFLKLLKTQAVEKNIPIEEAPRSKLS